MIVSTIQTAQEKALREEMLAEGWEFEKAGTKVLQGAAATPEERKYVGMDGRRFFDGKGILRWSCVCGVM